MEPQIEQIEYAGFWQRLGAQLIDLVILLPLTVLYLFGTVKFRLFTLYYFVPGLLISLLYHVYLVKRFGGTPGKLIVKTRVQRIDGAAMDYQTAFVRFSVLFCLSLLSSIASIIACFAMPDDGYASLGLLQKMTEISKHVPPWYRLVNVILNVWIWSEFIVILTNKKRRALHDFMAGTVVIRKK